MCFVDCVCVCMSVCVCENVYLCNHLPVLILLNWITPTPGVAVTVRPRIVSSPVGARYNTPLDIGSRRLLWVWKLDWDNGRGEWWLSRWSGVRWMRWKWLMLRLEDEMVLLVQKLMRWRNEVLSVQVMSGKIWYGYEYLPGVNGPGI